VSRAETEIAKRVQPSARGLWAGHGDLHRSSPRTNITIAARATQTRMVAHALELAGHTGKVFASRTGSSNVMLWRLGFNADPLMYAESLLEIG
jgi:hypothetical protein